MNFTTQECYINDKKYSIDEFIKNENLICECKEGKQNIYDKDGNEIIFCDGKKVKSYFRKLITEDNPMTKWHKEWQDEFSGYTEQKYMAENMHKKYRRADVDLNETQIIEFQYSRMTREEALNRKNDYSKVNKEIIWVIDGNNYDEKQNTIITELHHSDRIFIEFKNEDWKYASYIDYDVIYLNIKDLIYKINPSFIKSKMIDVQKPLNKKVFCEKLKKGEKIFDEEEITQTTIYVSQQGAGNGKTFRATNLLSEHFNNTKYHHYDVFLYLTKQHSAKTVIHDEFIDKDNDGNIILKSKHLSDNFELVADKNKFIFKFKTNKYAFGQTKENKKEPKNKKYFLNLKNKKTGKIHKIIIATIDSFIFALNNGMVRGIDKFMSMVNNIIDKDLGQKKSGHIKYAGGINLNKKMLLVGDEMQDLDEKYVKAIIKICRDRYVDFYMVGDILQSIKNEKNSFTFISNVELPNTIKLIKSVPENKIMRFGNKELIDFVNSVIPFEKYNLPKIEKHPNKSEDNEFSKLTIFSGNTIYADSKDKNKINTEVQKIMYYFKKEVVENKCKPKDFLIVTPFTKKNPLIEALHLEIREFWKNHYNSDKYEHYSVFHKSEDGTTIDLDESKESTRIVSIHTSKGDGREVVFVIGLTEEALKIYSDESNNLIYNSLLHVALTRMKKRLYIRYENNGDDICNKLLKCNSEDISSLYIDFNKNVELEKQISKQMIKNYDICYELIIKHTKYKDFKCENDEDTELIDIKHHCIRAVTSHILFLLSISNDVIINNKKKNEFIPQQFYRLLEKCLKTKIATYTNTKDYNKSLFDKDNGEMPILKYENGEYKQICNELINKIEKNKNKLKKLLDNKNPQIINFGVMESICLYHTLEVCENKYKSLLPIADMYDIIDLYLKCSNENKEEYLLSHYKKIELIKNIYNKITEKYQKLQWFWSKYSEFKGNTTSIKLYNSYQFIALNNNDVIICKICPQFNELNYNKIIYDSIFEIFLLKNSKDDKYINKNIILCVISLDLNEPFYIDFKNLLDDNKKTLLCMLKNNITSSYIIKNKGLYLLYDFYKKEYSNEIPSEIINKILDEVKKINKSDKPFPDYVFSFFEEIKILIKITKTQEKQKKILDDYNNEEHFMSEINSTMNESLNRFFGITDEDIEDFNNIKITDDNELNNNASNTVFSESSSATDINKNIKNIKQTKKTTSKKNILNEKNDKEQKNS